MDKISQKEFDEVVDIHPEKLEEGNEELSLGFAFLQANDQILLL